MKFEEILGTVRKKFGAADLSGIEGTLAFQFDLTGEGGGTFYAEVKDHALSVEPYEYYDRDALFILSSEDFLRVLDGRLDPVAAYTLGRLRIEGDLGKALELSKFTQR